MYMLLVVGFVTSGCGGETESTTEQEGPPASDYSGTDILDPNFATVQEMEQLPIMNPDLAEQLAQERPFINMTEFDTFIGARLDSTSKANLYKSLFLPINLNTASREEILLVPGIGERMAREFEEYRPYVDIEQFRREMGKYVDEDEVDRMQQYVFVPIDLNTATDEQILAIPGIGDRMLREFKEYRPYTNMEQFRREMGKYVDDREVARMEYFVEIRDAG